MERQPAFPARIFARYVRHFDASPTKYIGPDPRGQPFDIAWETAFRHGYDNLAQAALERALHGVEMPIYYQGEKVGSYRKFDERLTVALLTMRSKTEMPLLGRYRVAAEWHSERWEDLLEQIGEEDVNWDLRPDPSTISEEAELNMISERADNTQPIMSADKP